MMIDEVGENAGSVCALTPSYDRVEGEGGVDSDVKSSCGGFDVSTSEVKLLHQKMMVENKKWLWV